ncbi:hypothetical protein RMN57_22975 [Kitasatospora sp. CM 4170]|uniref:Secreted protein n=1 Tax=Kitasatospora aburaviensis TaxID=67265 RepID=A0ABW1F241_9ACTN|nr:hypothetical protein [Kitasatospora sp. CM 4170]WNM47356.1 hypothetical protein RMN57_22975 [Kitasatospora sp. CM 4170]
MNAAGWVGTVIGVLAGAAIVVNKIGELAHAVLDVRDGIRDRLHRGERNQVGRPDSEVVHRPEAESADRAAVMIKEP